MNKMVAEAILRHLGAECTVWARDGLESVEAVRTQPPFDVILMDIQARWGMPPTPQTPPV